MSPSSSEKMSTSGRGGSDDRTGTSPSGVPVGLDLDVDERLDAVQVGEPDGPVVQAVPVALEERRAPLELDRPEQHRLIEGPRSGSAA